MPAKLLFRLNYPAEDNQPNCNFKMMFNKDTGNCRVGVAVSKLVGGGARMLVAAISAPAMSQFDGAADRGST
jgi:hypothetical protein